MQKYWGIQGTTAQENEGGVVLFYRDLTGSSNWLIQKCGAIRVFICFQHRWLDPDVRRGQVWLRSPSKPNFAVASWMGCNRICSTETVPCCLRRETLRPVGETGGCDGFSCDLVIWPDPADLMNMCFVESSFGATSSDPRFIFVHEFPSTRWYNYGLCY